MTRFKPCAVVPSTTKIGRDWLRTVEGIDGPQDKTQSAGVAFQNGEQMFAHGRDEGTTAPVGKLNAGPRLNSLPVTRPRHPLGEPVFLVFGGQQGESSVQQFATVGLRFCALLRNFDKTAKARFFPVFMRVSCMFMLLSRNGNYAFVKHGSPVQIRQLAPFLKCWNTMV